MEWTAPPKPAELTEHRLIDAILTGIFPIDSCLPGERELANQLKVTRPTLREALQRLERDGWIEIHQGKPTRVRDYWHEGSLGVLGAIALHTQNLPEDFIPNLLAVRIALAPAYTRLAVENNAPALSEFLSGNQSTADLPEAFARFDWELHYRLTVWSGNPVFTLILNGFRELYQPMACRYFELPDSRRISRDFYSRLLQVAQTGKAGEAAAITQQVMQESLTLWNQTNHPEYSPGG